MKSVYIRLFVTFLQVPLLFYFLSKSTENFRAITSLKTIIVIKCKPIWNSFKRKKCDFFGVETICKLPTQPHLYSQLYIYLWKKKTAVLFFILLHWQKLLFLTVQNFSYWLLSFPIDWYFIFLYFFNI